MTQEIEARIEELTAIAQDMAYNDKYITMGIERQAWHKTYGNEERIYITCRTLSGNVKGSYKCGYVDRTTGEYIVKRFDNVNLETKEVM